MLTKNQRTMLALQSKLDQSYENMTRVAKAMGPNKYFDFLKYIDPIVKDPDAIKILTDDERAVLLGFAHVGFCEVAMRILQSREQPKSEKIDE